MIRLNHYSAHGALAVALSVCSLAGVLAGQTVSEPDLKREFDQSVRAAIPIAEALRSDQAGFLEAVQPYGPLDLLVQHPITGAHTSQLRDFFLGVVGGAARFDPSSFTNQWHCGPACATARRDSLIHQLASIRQLVARFRGVTALDVIATWPGRGYRVGLVTYDGRVWCHQSASPLMGFMPWQADTLSDSGAAQFHVLGSDRKNLEGIVADMRTGSVSVIAREAEGAIRVVLRGAIGNNEAGLLFVPAGAQPPPFNGAKMPDGRRYIGGERVAPDVYFYVTT